MGTVPIYHGSLTSVQYRDEILRPHFVPMAAAIGSSLIFMDDNARRHRDHPLHAMLQEESVVPMMWFICSPDLNSKEHFWDAMGHAL